MKAAAESAARPRLSTNAPDAVGATGWQPMTQIISGANLSLAWLAAFEHLVREGEDGRALNLMVVTPGGSLEDVGVRRTLDAFIAAEAKGAYRIDTVAGTIFPRDLYFPERLEDEAAAHLYHQYQQAYPQLRRHRHNSRGTYFGRLVAYDGAGQEPVNQLERVVERLRSQVHLRNPKSSAYEMSLSRPDDLSDLVATDEMRVQHPDDKSLMGFPCLSQVSLKLFRGRLHLSALYRNQYFISRAYGNYLGLSWLLDFLCREVGCEPGEIACWATHANAEVGTTAGLALVRRCREAAGRTHANGAVG